MWDPPVKHQVGNEINIHKHGRNHLPIGILHQPHCPEMQGIVHTTKTSPKTSLSLNIHQQIMELSKMVPHRGATHNFGNYANKGHNIQNVRCNYRNGHNSGQQWTSTPRDGSNYRSVNFNTTADGTINSSLVTLLDNYRRVQQDTTQALSKIIQLQDTKSNDVYINDLPKFSGELQQFLDWILKVEKIA